MKGGPQLTVFRDVRANVGYFAVVTFEGVDSVQPASLHASTL